MRRHSLVIALFLVLWGCATERPARHFEGHPLEEHVGRLLYTLLNENGYQIDAVRYLVWKNPEVNAFMSDDDPPVLGVTTGLLDSLSWDRDKDILAAAMAHELAHFKLNHIQKRKAVSYGTSAVLTVAGLFIPGVGLADMVLNPAITRAFGREQELSADREAVLILRKAGWNNPNGIVIKALEWSESMRPAAGGSSLWSTHPPTRDRIENIQNAFPARP